MIAFALLAALCWLVGNRLRGVLASDGDDPAYRTLLALIAGGVVLHLLLGLEFLLGVPWSRGSIVGGMALAALLAHLLARRQARPASTRLGLGWGDGVALAALAVFAVCAWKRWILYQDFVYHWGIKAEKFFLARGIDSAFLTQAWDLARHPEYPLLWPNLLASTAILDGAFREPILMLWTVLAFGGLLAGARQVLAMAGVERWLAQATLAVLGLAIAAFAIGYQMAGNPDFLIALAPLAAWPLLQRSGGTASALALGLVAALAAGVKTEGLPLALFLVLACALSRPTDRLRALLITGAPVALVAVPWLLYSRHLGLALRPHGGGLSFEHFGTIVRAVAESLATPEWHGIAWVLLALPLLLWPERTRAIAAVCLLQLGFYFLVYLSSPAASAEQAEFFVRSNCARLAFHLVPTTLVAMAVVAGGGLKSDLRNPAPAATR